MKIETSLTHEKVRYDQENEVHLVLTLTAPKKDWQNRRPPICVIPVVDISGSMNGPKLEYAKQSVIKLIDHLQPGDYCGLAAFSTDVYPIAPPREMTQAQKEELKSKVGAMAQISSTNFSGGLLQGLAWGREVDLSEGVVVRVIMFTDGNANCGVETKLDGLVKLLKNRGRVTVSAFGYGHDADQDLLASFAKEGAGNYAFIKNPDDAASAFAKELGGLLSSYAVNVSVALEAQNGHKIAEILSDVDVKDDNGKAVITLTDILSEESRQIVARLTLTQQAQPLPRDMTIVNASVSYELVGEDGKTQKKTETLKAKIRFVKSGEEQTDPTKAVDEIVARAFLIKAQVEAEVQANVGNYAGAQAVMQTMRARAKRGGHDAIALVAEKLGGKMANSLCYASSGGYRKSVQSVSIRAMGIASIDPEAALDFAPMGISLSNSAQDSMTASFSGGTGVIHPPAPPHPLISPLLVPNPLAGNPFAAPPPPSAPPSKEKPSKLGKSRSKRW